MAQTPQYAGFLFTVWLLFAVSCLADKAPSASIEFTLGPQTQRRHRRSGQYGTSEVVYGPLVPRINGAHNQSELLGRAMPGEPGKDEYGPLITVPGCWFCPPIDIALKTGRALLDALDTATMQRYMRITDDSSLWNKCVFYTASTTKPNPEYLSEKASTWACSKNKLSVWVSKPMISAPILAIAAGQHVQLTQSSKPAPLAKQGHGNQPVREIP